MHSMGPAKVCEACGRHSCNCGYVPRPLEEIVRDVLARGDDRACTMPAIADDGDDDVDESGVEKSAGWRTDPDVKAQLAALTSLDLNKYDTDTKEYPCVETRRSFGPGMGDPVKRMLGVCAPVYVCIYMHMYSVFIPLSG